MGRLRVFDRWRVEWLTEVPSPTDYNLWTEVFGQRWGEVAEVTRRKRKRWQLSAAVKVDRWVRSKWVNKMRM